MVPQKADLIGALAVSLDEDRRFLEVSLKDCPSGEAAQIEKLVARGMITMERGYRIWAEMLGLPFHGLEERTREVGRGGLLPGERVARLGEGEVGEVGHSTTLGTRKKWSSVAGALPTMISG